MKYTVPVSRPDLNSLGDKDAADIAALTLIHSYKRPHGSKSERQFIQRMIDCVPNIKRDASGNRILRIGDSPNVAYCCHTDTVHRDSGRQHVAIDDDIMRLSKPDRSNCLGADDGAGIWLMLEMIRAGKPGLYIFHRGEEVGGLGSCYIATSTPELLDGIEAAIAFDRKGYQDVITYMGSKVASDTFAWSLANAIGLDYMPDDTGLFTDTANYADIVPECTNISVGYHGAHGHKETLDLRFLLRLRDHLLAADWSSLSIERAPGDDGWQEDWSTDLRDYREGAVVCPGYDEDIHSLEQAVIAHPDIAATMLECMGVNVDEFWQQVYETCGGERRAASGTPLWESYDARPYHY